MELFVVFQVAAMGTDRQFSEWRQILIKKRAQFVCIRKRFHRAAAAIIGRINFI